ncbi:MAG: 30S ribosomal protein S6 [Candidatus Peribacteraceae bacterium]|nr:30S ribosomal protein S6 [Candidatus Peribacteraceae bacterium]
MPELIATGEDTRIYECAILTTYPLPQKDEAALVKEVEGYFEEVGAKLVSKDAWGRRGLAYPIKGIKEANITIYYYEMDPLKLKEVDQSLKIAKGVLRHLFVKPPKHYQVVKYSDAYEQWLKERESVDQKRTREKQAALEEKVAAKARRKVQMKSTEKKAEPKAVEKMSGEEVTKSIDKLITDDLDSL